MSGERSAIWQVDERGECVEFGDCGENDECARENNL